MADRTDEEIRALRETVDQMRLDAANTRASERLAGIEKQVGDLRGEVQAQGLQLQTFCERTQARHEALTGKVEDIKTETGALRKDVLDALRESMSAQHDLGRAELDGETQVRIAKEQASAKRWEVVGDIIGPPLQDKRVWLGAGVLALLAIIAFASPEYLGLVLDRVLGEAPAAVMAPASPEPQEDAAADSEAPAEEPDALTGP